MDKNSLWKTFLLNVNFALHIKNYGNFFLWFNQSFQNVSCDTIEDLFIKRFVSFHKICSIFVRKVLIHNKTSDCLSKRSFSKCTHILRQHLKLLFLSMIWIKWKWSWSLFEIWASLWCCWMSFNMFFQFIWWFRDSLWFKNYPKLKWIAKLFTNWSLHWPYLLAFHLQPYKISHKNPFQTFT